MCTVTLIPLADGLCLVTNRDENRQRPAALAPLARPLANGLIGLYPTDPQGSGTWVAVNTAGLVITLLNQNAAVHGAKPPVAKPPVGLQSRGLITLALLSARSVAQAIDHLHQLDLRLFGPFRLLIADQGGMAIATADGTQSVAAVTWLALGPMMLTSSSLGDELVAEPRQRLFSEMVVRDWASMDDCGRLGQQAAFHQHRWPEASHLSVRMSRHDARTVSRTVVQISPERIRMAYCDVDEATGDGELMELSLPQGHA